MVVINRSFINKRVFNMYFLWKFYSKSNLYRSSQFHIKMQKYKIGNKYYICNENSIKNLKQSAISKNKFLNISVNFSEFSETEKNT